MVPVLSTPVAIASTSKIPTSNVELCAEFLRLEEELDLFHQEMDGVYFWEYLRFYVFLELQRSLGLANLEPFQAGSSWSRWLKRLSSGLSALFHHNPFFSRQKPLVFFGCPRRTPDEHGVWWDTQVDPLLDYLGLPYYYIERFSGDRHLTPAHTRHIKYFDLLSMLSCGYRMVHRGAGFSGESEDFLRHLQKKLELRFGVRLDLMGMAGSIWKTRLSLLRSFEQIFRKVQPRAVFFASINYPERAAIEVCKRLGIPVVELQHGVIGSFDLCYVFPKNVHLHYYPDYLLVYGDFWKRCIDFPLPPERILSIGFPYLESRITECGKAEKASQVVFLSQPTVGEQLSRFAVELSERRDFPYKVIYRLHPYENAWQSRYPWLAKSGVTVTSGKDGSLYSLLGKSQIQVGAYSAAIFEGLAFGLTTYLVNVPGVEYMQPLIDQGWCQLVDAPSQIPVHPSKHIPIDRDFFFRASGLENFRQALVKIVGTDLLKK